MGKPNSTNPEYIVTTFYKVLCIEDPKALQLKLLKLCKEAKIKGTILVTTEGINGTVSGIRSAINNLYNGINEIDALLGIEYLETISQYIPFQRTKVLLKKEVVAMKAGVIDMVNRGLHVRPEEWDGLISQDDVTLIDTRNDFEVAFGTFDRAVNPKTQRFSEFAKWASEFFNQYDKNAKIAMFCTGGIRCEKSTAYMKSIGFNNVYHLKGGILNYLDKTKNKSGKWHGSCFVFDDRLALDDMLRPIEDEAIF